MITRFALELPWCSVWVDVCDLEMKQWGPPADLAAMLHSELRNAAHQALSKQVLHSFTEALTERMVTTVQSL
jgi:hypothetical protein